MIKEMQHSKSFVMTNSNKGLVLTLFVSVSPTAVNAASLSELVRKDIEQTFATSVLLNDTDVFTFGINNFDPNKVFSLDNEDIGSNDSVSHRQILPLEQTAVSRY